MISFAGGEHSLRAVFTKLNKCILSQSNAKVYTESLFGLEKFADTALHFAALHAVEICNIFLHRSFSDVISSRGT